MPYIDSMQIKEVERVLGFQLGEEIIDYLRWNFGKLKFKLNGELIEINVNVYSIYDLVLSESELEYRNSIFGGLYE